MAKSEMSPANTRLDRLLHLVTEHESLSRKQEMTVIDLGRRMSSLEQKLSSELQQMAPLQERDVARELDMARLAMEGLVKQLVALSKSVQGIQAQQQEMSEAIASWQAATLKLDARQAALEEHISGMQQEHSSGSQQDLMQVDVISSELGIIREQLIQLGTLRADVDQLQDEDRSAAALAASVEATTAAIRQQLAVLDRKQQHTSALLESRLDEQASQLHTALSAAINQRSQALSSELRREVAAARKELSMAATAGGHALESWVHTQAGSLSSQVSSCEMRLQSLEASTGEYGLLRQSTEAALQQVEEVGQEVKRVKKHVVKWQQKFLAWEQQAAKGATDAEALVVPLRGQLAEMRAALVQLTAHLQRAASEAASSSRQTLQIQANVSALADATCTCLRRCTDASQPAMPSSGPALTYLPPSLRPQPFSYHPLGNPAMVAAVADFSCFVERLHAQLNGTCQRALLPQAFTETTNTAPAPVHA